MACPALFISVVDLAAFQISPLLLNRKSIQLNFSTKNTELISLVNFRRRCDRHLNDIMIEIMISRIDTSFQLCEYCLNISLSNLDLKLVIELF